MRLPARLLSTVCAALMFGALGVCLSGCGGSSTAQKATFRQNQLLINNQVATDAITAQPLKFVHVQLGAAGGDGTFEHPFGTIAQAIAAAQSGAILYVQAGTNPGIPPFTLPNGVKALSTGPSEFINTQQAGAVLLPLSGNGVLPAVTDTITIGNDTSVVGFNINPATGSGILGNDVTGNITLTDNTVQKAISGQPGIAVISNTGTANVVLTRNTVSNATSNGIMVESDGAAHVTATVSKNVTNNNVGSGLFFFLNNGQMNASITNNTASGNQTTMDPESGIRFGAFNAAQGNATISGNNASANTGNGIFIGSDGTSHVMATLSQNTTNNNTGNGIFIGTNQTGNASCTVNNNTSNGNKVNAALAPFPTGNGIFTGSQVSAADNTICIQNTVKGNAADGILCFVANNGSLQAQVNFNTVNANTQSGIEFNIGLNGAPGNPPNPGDAPQGAGTISNNMVVGNLGNAPPLGGAGILIDNFNSATTHLAIANNTVQSNATAQGAFGGMGIVATQNSKIYALVQSNTISTNGGANPGFTALSGVPATILGGALSGPASVFLQLTNNSSDTGFALLHLPGTTFQASASGNTGPVIQPALPTDPLTTPVP